MPKRLFIGVNAACHDSSVFFLDPDTREIFAVTTELVSRVKHDGTGIRGAVALLVSFLGLEDDDFTLDISEAYESDSWFCGYRFGEENLRLARLELQRELRRSRDTSDGEELDSLVDQRQAQLLATTRQRYGGGARENLERFMRRDLGECADRIHGISFYDHHYCHCLGAYAFSPFAECLSVSMDYSGDGYFSRCYVCRDGEMKLVAASPVFEPEEPDYVSLSKVYTKVTAALGFRPNCDEGKVEALAAFGDGRNRLYEDLTTAVTLDEDLTIRFAPGSKYLVAPSYLRRAIDAFGREEVAAAVQRVLEEVIVSYLDALIRETGVRDVCFSGGTFANVKLNLAVRERTSIAGHYIFPAMGDSGAAAGALLARLREVGAIRLDALEDAENRMPFWGPSYDDAAVRRAIAAHRGRITAEHVGDSWPEYCAERLCEGDIFGVFEGRCEFGPRALGHRSILADARDPAMRERLNVEIKGRPPFQPFCPAVLEEDREELFEGSYSNRHMTCAFRMRDDFAEKYPSAVHIDGTARPQFVTHDDNPNLYRLLRRVKETVGHGIVINTSFNKHGRSLVLTPADAIVDFLDTGLDFFCAHGHVIRRRQPHGN